MIWIIFQILISESTVLSMLEILPAFYVMGLIYSLPTFVIFVIVYQTLNKKNITTLKLKCLLLIVGLGGIFSTFRYIDGTISMELALFYGFVMALLIWGIKMKRQ